ncbi:hypothetical protein D3C71_1101400 [compost metagenome]
MPRVKIGQGQGTAHLSHECGFLFDGVDTSHRPEGPHDRQDDPRKPPTRSHVVDLGRHIGRSQRVAEGLHGSHAVEQMLDQHLLRIPYGGQVVGAIPALHLRQIIEQLGHRCIVGVQAQLLACASESAGHVRAGLIGGCAHAACLREP